jgi:hypothetical protein
MTKAKIPNAPSGTGPGGRRLWRDVLGSYELDEHEMALLVEATRTVDDLDGLAAIVKAEGRIVTSKAGPRAHPALVEARQLRIALARLLAALRLPDGEQGDESQGRRTQRRVGARGVYRTGLRSVS